MTVDVGIEAPRQPELLEFLRRGDEYTLSLYPPESCHLLGVDELEAPEVTVLVARSAGKALGMVALIDNSDGTAELKRMFVTPAARGRGIAAALIRSLETVAADAGTRTVRLETGPLQHAAIRLYERSGYRPIPNFGKYVGDPNSVCYEKALA